MDAIELWRNVDAFSFALGMVYLMIFDIGFSVCNFFIRKAFDLMKKRKEVKKNETD